jgi:hypothetical protein
VTVWQWTVGLVLAVGGVVWAVAKADLEDPDLYRWLTRKLIFRAALRLPREERARWRAEALQNVLDLPGRLAPLLWALDTYAKAGRWGKTRGAPSRWQTLVVRIRATWHRLRSLPQVRAKARSRQLHPSKQARPVWTTPAEAEEAKAAAAALDARVNVGSTILNDGGMAFDQIRITKRRGSSSLLSKQDEEFLARVDEQSKEFMTWLAQQRNDFEAGLRRFW